MPFLKYITEQREMKKEAKEVKEKSFLKMFVKKQVLQKMQKYFLKTTLLPINCLAKMPKMKELLQGIMNLYYKEV